LEFENIKLSVSQNPYKEDIITTGFLDGKELYEYKKILDIGVMPSSNWYGAPNKIFEYGASKMAVAAPKTPTIESLIPKDTISFFENNSENDLFEKLSELCADKNLISQKAVKLNDFIKQNYSEKITLDFYLNILNERK